MGNGVDDRSCSAVVILKHRRLRDNMKVYLSCFGISLANHEKTFSHTVLYLHLLAFAQRV